ncbi:DUF2247 family protein [Cytobacillus firmus]|uniref:DUF2247 domain-containing protein n=1 Tax=Cytobacillus firmus DS1 TaxID=1307436 RepID=W7KN05_CYTFI|nr:DUF2247 family protein [Cytobacillus firmus]EWG08815.1 hypothetical protein PBF_22162 [Cytobacillus firmus DS1]
MGISMDIFKQNKIKYDWKTLYVGFKLDLIMYSDIVNYAAKFIAEHPDTSNQNIVQLAWGGENIDYESLLVDILKDSHINDFNLDTDIWQLEKRKWRFGILAYLKRKYQENFEELLNKITEVYADFNYPEDMDSFINYLEPKDGYNPSKYSKEENVIRLINLFNDFMNQIHDYIQNDKLVFDID